MKILKKIRINFNLNKNIVFGHRALYGYCYAPLSDGFIDLLRVSAHL